MRNLTAVFLHPLPPDFNVDGTRCRRQDKLKTNRHSDNIDIGGEGGGHRVQKTAVKFRTGGIEISVRLGGGGEQDSSISLIPIVAPSSIIGAGIDRRS